MSDDMFASVRGKARRPWPAKALCDYIDPEGSMGRPQVAAAIDVPRATFDLAFHEGLTDKQADTWAVRAGTHPALLWGWAWFEAAPPVVECGHPDCVELVDPPRRFCSNRCSTRARAREAA